MVLLCPVLIEVEQEILDRGLATIRRDYEISTRRGTFTQAQVDRWVTLITPAVSYSALSQVREDIKLPPLPLSRFWFQNFQKRHTLLKNFILHVRVHFR